MNLEVRLQSSSSSSSSSPVWYGWMPRWSSMRSRRVLIPTSWFSMSSKSPKSRYQLDWKECTGERGGGATVDGPASPWACRAFCHFSRPGWEMFFFPIPRRQTIEADNSVLNVTNCCRIPCKLTSKHSNTKESRGGNDNLNEVICRLAVDLIWLMMMFGRRIRA